MHLQTHVCYLLNMISNNAFTMYNACRTCIHNACCTMHTPSLQLQPSEAATGFIVQLHRICLHLQKQMCLAAGSFCCCLLCLIRLNGTACCSVDVYRSRAPLLVDKAKPPFVQANLAKRLTATVRIHFQVVGSNFSRNTAMNGAGFAIQQVTSMSMNNLSIMVRASCQHFTKTDACTFSLMHLGPASCPALAIWFLAKTALYIAFDNSNCLRDLASSWQTEYVCLKVGSNAGKLDVEWYLSINMGRSAL